MTADKEPEPVEGVPPSSTDVTEPISSGVTPSVDAKPEHPHLSEYQNSVFQVAVTPPPKPEPPQIFEYQTSDSIVNNPPPFYNSDLEFDDIDMYLLPN
ncbi:hypothetical protein [Vaccinia virus]|uniref:Uncharacterized protein n=1 Tax=Vaccinia virus TaxID=10245 RepID=A0A2I6J1F7_VACCV|nr:hypothetical protein [Vaccinia virus]